MTPTKTDLTGPLFLGNNVARAGVCISAEVN